MKVTGQSFVVLAFGLRLGVRGIDRRGLDALRLRFPPSWKFVPLRRPSPRVDRWFAPTKRQRTGAAPDRWVEVLGSRMQSYLSEHAKTHVLVHAGVVAFGESAVLIPGSSGSGKSSLIAHLVREGATYLSDEYAAIDPDGWIHPYSRPIALRNLSRRRITRVRADEMGGRIGTTPLRAGVILEAPYRRGAGFRPRALSRVEMMGLLARNSVAPRYRPEAALRAFTLATLGARGFAGTRGTTGQVARWLRVISGPVSPAISASRRVHLQ